MFFPRSRRSAWALALLACGAPAVSTNANHSAAPPPSVPALTQTAVPEFPPPPPTARQATADTLHGVRVEDPYRWLEPGEDPAVLSWVQEQSSYARRALDALPTQGELTRRFTEILYLDAISCAADERSTRAATRPRKRACSWCAPTAAPSAP
jgi:hypothetical protein